MNKTITFPHGIRIRSEPPLITFIDPAMEEEKTEGTSTEIDTNFASLIDGAALLVTSHKLNGQNYLQLERQQSDTYEKVEWNCPFSKEEMDTLQKMLHQTILTAGKSGTTTVTRKGNFLHALHTSKAKPKSWITDLGASDHMTGDIYNI